ncbi:corticotropin-releasing factor receptor 2-like [Diadema antillarum]|uniref:corticotropin-releasing factor receptor 2-like n=1 Tax=Diadema antillarum TaxID=105358 RepID=UPI003A8AF7B5
MLRTVLYLLLMAAGIRHVTGQDSVADEDETLQQALQLAKQCEAQYVNFTFEEGDEHYQGVHCHAEYDLLLCWPPTKAGETTYLPCPELADQYQTTMAFRECTLNGTWSTSISPEEMYLNGKYCKCLHCEIITTINQFGCGLSALACIVAFLIFLFSRRLWCRRNHIHWHLISSFILSYFVYFVALGIRSAYEGKIKWLSGLLDTLYYYSLMTNYFWMLVEGLYLHTLVVFALRIDANRISFLIYIFIGWLLPAMLVSIWAIVSHFTSGEFAGSLAENGSIQDYVCVIGPIGLALFINCIFLFNIMRCLCKKLREQMRNEEQQSWRGAKATMVLVVLLGVHYVVFLIIVPIVESQLGITVTLVLQYINTLLTSTQGLQVSVIYVFLNSEVKSSIKRTAVKLMRKQDCPCMRRRLGGRQRNSSYSRWFTDENTCLSTLRSSPSRHPNGGRINSDMAASLNGGISGNVEKQPCPPVSTAPAHSPIKEKSDEFEKYELGTMTEKPPIDKEAEKQCASPAQEDIPLLKNRRQGSARLDNGNSNGSPQTGVRAAGEVKYPDDTPAKSNETQHLTAHQLVC